MSDSWDALTDREREISPPQALVQPRAPLGEVSGMVGSLLSEEPYIEPAADARKTPGIPQATLDKAIATLEVWMRPIEGGAAARDLNGADRGRRHKPRLHSVRYVSPVRRASPPLFESMEIIGKPVTVARLKAARASVTPVWRGLTRRCDPTLTAKSLRQ